MLVYHQWGKRKYGGKAGSNESLLNKYLGVIGHACNKCARVNQIKSGTTRKEPECMCQNAEKMSFLEK